MLKSLITVSLVTAYTLILFTAQPTNAEKTACCPLAGRDLFNGKNLDGFTKRGGPAVYTVEGDCIVGRPQPGEENTFLCTDQEYGDFILDVDFYDENQNSGIQFRSHENSEFKQNRVHGYQCEIDPSSRAWTGGIYDESRRNWLYNLNANDAARNAFKQKDWNHLRIEAIGDSIRTWINGVPASDLVDSMTLTGFIGLQVHSTKNPEGKFVKWKNVRIQDLGKHQWQPFWTLESMDGYKTFGPAKWELKNHILAATSDGAAQSLLLSDNELNSFTLKMKFLVQKGSAAFCFRTYQDENDPNFYGYKVILDNQKDGMTGGLIQTGARELMIKPFRGISKHWENKDWLAYKPGEWNLLTVSSQGQRIVIFVNNRKTAELRYDPSEFRHEAKLPSHRIGFELLAGQATELQIQDIQILLPAK